MFLKTTVSMFRESRARDDIITLPVRLARALWQPCNIPTSRANVRTCEARFGTHHDLR